MRLMRWLTACRSLKSVEDGPSPYRMVEQHLVPQFGRGGVVQSAQCKVQIEKVLEPHQCGPRTRGWMRLGPALGKRLRSWFVDWVIEPWRPVVMRAKALCRPPKLPGRPRRRIKAPIQAELLLDTVRVVRNDLRDDDLLASGKAMYAGPGPGAGAGRAWGRITSRIFGPGQSVR